MSKKQSPKTHKADADAIVRNVKRQTRRKFNSEESVAELCRCEGIHQNLYYRWSREFLEAGKKRLEGDTLREVSTSEVRRGAMVGVYCPCGEKEATPLGFPLSLFTST